MKSELFGHLKGSFTGTGQDRQGLFQAASGETLLLDEVVDLPLHTQVKLLRAIQEKAVRPVRSQAEQAVVVRLLFATHKNMAQEQEIEQDRLRQDLFFRINLIKLSVSAPRERTQDLQDLADALLRRVVQSCARECYFTMQS